MVLSGELIHYGTFEERQGERTVIDAQGWYLTPSFIDHHCHVYPTGTEMGLYADTYAFPQGCTASEENQGMVAQKGKGTAVQRASARPSSHMRM